MSFGIYLVGYIIMIVGLGIGAHLMRVPPQWIGVGVLVLVGIGILHGVTATRQKDSSSELSSTSLSSTSRAAGGPRIYATPHPSVRVLVFPGIADTRFRPPAPEAAQESA